VSTVQEARAQAVFQPRQVLAHHGARQGEVVGGEREAAALDHAHEDGDVGEGVQGLVRFREQSYATRADYQTGAGP